MDVLRKNAMGSDDDIHFAFRQPIQHFGDLLLVAKAAEHFHLHREWQRNAA